MWYRGIREAELALYGSPTYSMSVRRAPPGGEDRIDDMAQAWIDGDRETVLRYAEEHMRAVRLRVVKRGKTRGRPRSVDRACVIQRLGEGHTWKETAELCGCSVSSAWRAMNDIARKDRA
jgi:hypothetical protein